MGNRKFFGKAQETFQSLVRSQIFKILDFFNPILFHVTFGIYLATYFFSFN
jgi:hypothetical protein